MASPTPQKLEELLLDLIEKVEDPVVKVQYLTKFQKILVRETEEPKPKSFKSQVNLQEILNRFTKVEKEVTVSDLQHEIKEIKSEVRTLKEEVRKLGQALTILRIDHNFLDQKMKHQDNTSHQGNDEAGPSYQNPLDDEEVENIFDESANLSLQTKDKTARIHDQLFNLKCPTLSDFRWYKDVFITRVMLRDDCNSPLWKEKFINGLPSLFAYKILLTLSSPSGVIDYDNLTYGDISTVIHRECQKMCNDIEISRKAKSTLRGFSATRFVLEFSLIALRATSRWPLQQLKPAEPSDVLVWLRELIQDLSYIRLAFNGSAMVSIIRDFKFMYQARMAQSMSCLWIRNQISIQFPIRLNCWL